MQRVPNCDPVSVLALKESSMNGILVPEVGMERPSLKVLKTSGLSLA
jgi:hypothetical protein